LTRYVIEKANTEIVQIRKITIRKSR